MYTSVLLCISTPGEEFIKPPIEQIGQMVPKTSSAVIFYEGLPLLVQFKEIKLTIVNLTVQVLPFIKLTFRVPDLLAHPLLARSLFLRLLKCGLVFVALPVHLPIRHERTQDRCRLFSTANWQLYEQLHEVFVPNELELVSAEQLFFALVLILVFHEGQLSQIPWVHPLVRTVKPSVHGICHVVV